MFHERGSGTCGQRPIRGSIAEYINSEARPMLGVPVATFHNGTEYIGWRSGSAEVRKRSPPVVRQCSQRTRAFCLNHHAL